MNRLSTTISLVLFGMLLSTAGTVQAQVPNVSRISVSNYANDWSASQDSFDASSDVYVYLVFGTSAHSGFTFSGQCVFNLSATHQELGRVSIPSTFLGNGQDVVRSNTFTMTWPQATVELTCVPDYNPAGAFSSVLSSDLWAQTGTAAGTSTPEPIVPDAHAQPYVPNVPHVPNVPTVVIPNVVIPNVVIPNVVIPNVPTPPVVIVELPSIPEAVVVETCESVLLGVGNSASSLMFCDGADRACAVALLHAGHDPSSLIFCDSPVNSACAVQLLQNGGDPTDIIFCD